MIPCDIQENTLKADDSQSLSPFCLHLDEKASLSTKTYSACSDSRGPRRVGDLENENRNHLFVLYRKTAIKPN